MTSHCIQCRHYYISWDPKAPYGCRALGFKSRRLPAVVVQEVSGQPCAHIVLKQEAHTHAPAGKRGLSK